MKVLRHTVRTSNNLLRLSVLSYIISAMEANGTYTFTMLFEPAEEGGFVVTCTALPGLVTEGDTLEEARRMAEDALRGYVESLLEDVVSIPPDKNPHSPINENCA